MTPRSAFNPGLLAGSVLLLVLASLAARYLGRGLREGKVNAAPIEALVLMLVNILQLVAVMFILIAIFGE